MDDPFDSQPPEAKMDNLFQPLKAAMNNPFQLHQTSESTTDDATHVEPLPTRHDRFMNRLTGFPRSSQRCNGCSNKDKIVQALEEKVEHQAEFIKTLKGQRKELEDYINKLLGQIGMMKRDQN